MSVAQDKGISIPPQGSRSALGSMAVPYYFTGAPEVTPRKFRAEAVDRAVPVESTSHNSSKAHNGLRE